MQRLHEKDVFRILVKLGPIILPILNYQFLHTGKITVSDKLIKNVLDGLF